MPAFYMTPEIKAKRQKMRIELGILKMKEKLFGKLSEKDTQRLKEIRLEFSKHY